MLIFDDHQQSGCLIIMNSISRNLKKPEKISVDLLGQDFYGLGLAITGNMKDGIFIRDVLSRGPANESKKIKRGKQFCTFKRFL